VVDKHTGELVADRAVQQGCRHRRIDAAGQAQDHVLGADLLANFGDCFVDIIAHLPVGARAADIEYETAQQSCALHCVRDFRMELRGIETARFVGHARDRARWGRQHQLETFRHRGDFVTMAHPHLEHAVAFAATEVLDPFE